MMFKHQESCLHEWKLSDFESYVDSSLDISKIYTITCLKCGKTRKTDEYEFYEMKSLGLIK